MKIFYKKNFLCIYSRLTENHDEDRRHFDGLKLVICIQ